MSKIPEKILGKEEITKLESYAQIEGKGLMVLLSETNTVKLIVDKLLESSSFSLETKEEERAKLSADFYMISHPIHGVYGKAVIESSNLDDIENPVFSFLFSSDAVQAFSRIVMNESLFLITKKLLDKKKSLEIEIDAQSLKKVLQHMLVVNLAKTTFLKEGEIDGTPE